MINASMSIATANSTRTSENRLRAGRPPSIYRTRRSDTRAGPTSSSTVLPVFDWIQSVGFWGLKANIVSQCSAFRSTRRYSHHFQALTVARDRNINSLAEVGQDICPWRRLGTIQEFVERAIDYATP
jgi:hypothetical protein